MRDESLMADAHTAVSRPLCRREIESGKRCPPLDRVSDSSNADDDVKINLQKFIFLYIIFVEKWKFTTSPTIF